MTNQHPATARVHDARAQSLSLRIADAITAFAGSMTFIYVHVVIFAAWVSTGLFGRDVFPFNFLTMAVSLEAIFLATFVMIGQNRQAELAQAKADHDFVEQEQELHANTELTREVHAMATANELHAQQLFEMLTLVLNATRVPDRVDPPVTPKPRKPRAPRAKAATKTATKGT